MQAGDIVYLPFKDEYIKYTIKTVIDDDLFVIEPRSKITNIVSKSEVFTENQFNVIYNGEKIYE